MTDWKKLGELLGTLPGVQPVASGYARQVTQRLLGFAMLWHIFGGFHEIIDAGAVAQSTAYREAKEFRQVFGMTVEEFNAKAFESDSENSQSATEE